MAPELGAEAHILYHVPRLRRSRGALIESPPPALPHGERAGLADVEFPGPTCQECGDPIYYEQRRWHHRDGRRQHDAVAEEADDQATCTRGHPWIEANLTRHAKTGKSECRLCKNIRLREYRLRKKILDTLPNP